MQIPQDRVLDFGKDNDELRYARLHDRLTKLAALSVTAEAVAPPGYWSGDRAGERRVVDDWTSGRLSWREMHNAALKGLKALERGDLDLADAYAWISNDHQVDALMTAIRPSALANLAKSAKPRTGRPRKKSQN